MPTTMENIDDQIKMLVAASRSSAPYVMQAQGMTPLPSGAFEQSPPSLAPSHSAALKSLADSVNNETANVGNQPSPVASAVAPQGGIAGIASGIEAGSPIDYNTMFGLMRGREEPVVSAADQSRKDRNRALLEWGLRMMAESGKPGATFGGAAGTAGVGTLSTLDALKKERLSESDKYETAKRAAAANLFNLASGRRTAATTEDYKNKTLGLEGRKVDILGRNSEADIAYKGALGRAAEMKGLGQKAGSADQQMIRQLTKFMPEKMATAMVLIGPKDDISLYSSARKQIDDDPMTMGLPEPEKQRRAQSAVDAFKSTYRGMYDTLNSLATEADGEQPETDSSIPNLDELLSSRGLSLNPGQ